MISQTTAERLKQSSEWTELRRHIIENIASLNTLADINFTDKEAAAIEGRARELAIEKLNAILEPFDFTSAPDVDNSARAKTKHGLQ